MHRIATALLIAAAVLALNTGMLREAFARDLEMPIGAARPPFAQPIAATTPKVLSLLLVLESLRQAPVALDGQKV